MLERTSHARRVRALLARSPVVALLGPRQAGKTTLARRILASRRTPGRHFDLENPRERSVLEDDPMGALEGLRGLVVLDEVQHAPEIFRVLRVLADRKGPPARFLVLGSASESLLRQTSESLAGRIAFHDLPPLGLDETGPRSLATLWFRGGFPRSFLAPDDAESFRWRRDFLRTAFQRDLPLLGVRVPPATLERFATMLAHLHGRIWDASDIARSFGVAHTTVLKWLDSLRATFLVRVLRPWHENLSKRQVKSPRVFLADTGLLHALHGLETPGDLEGHPVVGPSWESFGLDTVIRRLGARPDQCHFWATQQGAELDLLVVAGRRRLGFEFKRTTAPRVTPSMRIALADLRLEELVVVHGGAESFPMGERIRAVPLAEVLSRVKPLA